MKQKSSSPRERDVTILRSNRKTVSLEIKADGRLLVRAPLAMKDADIRQFLRAKSGWIEKHLQILREKQELRENEPQEPRLTLEELHALADSALVAIPPRVKHYAQILGVTYGRITIRNQTSRWGSCSARGNLNFNCLLMLMPPEMMDYTVVHELCHRKEMNHSPAFWALVASVLPDYRERAQWMREHGEAILRRMRG